MQPLFDYRYNIFAVFMLHILARSLSAVADFKEFIWELVLLCTAVCRLNQIACQHLDQLEESYPIICAPTEQVTHVKYVHCVSLVGTTVFC